MGSPATPKRGPSKKKHTQIDRQTHKQVNSTGRANSGFVLLFEGALLQRKTTRKTEFNAAVPLS